MDLTATILAAGNVHRPAGAKLEGINLVPLLQRGRSKPVQRTLFWRFNTAARRQRAGRMGDYKLLIDSDHLLRFNLRRDIGKREDLAMARPDLVSKLATLLDEWEKDVDTEARSLGRAQ